MMNQENRPRPNSDMADDSWNSSLSPIFKVSTYSNEWKLRMSSSVAAWHEMMSMWFRRPYAAIRECTLLACDKHKHRLQSTWDPKTQELTSLFKNSKNRLIVDFFQDQIQLRG